MEKLSVLIFVVALVHQSSAQCLTTFNLQPNFNLENFLGTWYLYSSNFDYFNNLGVSCISTNWIENPNGTVSATNYGNMMGEFGTSNPFNVPASIRVVSPGSLLYAEGDITAPWHVLSTDYVNYAVTQSCVMGHNDFGILSRTPTIQPEIQTLANSVLKANNLSPAEMIVTTRFNC